MSTSADAPPARARAVQLLRRPVAAVVLLIVVYVALSFVTDPGGYLGTDTGGKVATLEAMVQRGDWNPDVGYWAAQWDPEGRVHGLIYTSRVGDRWINVTSLPMIFAARPLYAVGGYRATLLLPMLGAALAALAARALVRRLGAGDGWPAFWLVGLASPLLVYALDLWEHTWGVALMAWAVVALLDAVSRGPTWWRGALAGLAFGAAASMRTEAFAYGFVIVAVCLVVIVWRDRTLIVRALGLGAAAAVGFVATFGASQLLELAVLGASTRSSRAEGTATAAAFSQVGERLREGAVTLLAPIADNSTQTILLGALGLLGLLLVAWYSRDEARERFALVGAGLIVVVYVVVVSAGLGFVPGLIVATPFAAIGLALAWTDDTRRLLALFALIPLPVVFAFQFRGGAVPQWAGRYILLSGFLLMVVGISQRARLAVWADRGLIALAIGVTAFGFLWLVQRSHDVARAGDAFAARTEDVLINTNGFMPRELGATYGQGPPWLSLSNPDDLQFAVDVATESGARTIGVVDGDPKGHPEQFAGWEPVSVERVPWITGTSVWVVTYDRVPSG